LPSRILDSALSSLYIYIYIHLLVGYEATAINEEHRDVQATLL